MVEKYLNFVISIKMHYFTLFFSFLFSHIIFISSSQLFLSCTCSCLLFDFSIEETWRLWKIFLRDYNSFSNWLGSIENDLAEFSDSQISEKESIYEEIEVCKDYFSISPRHLHIVRIICWSGLYVRLIILRFSFLSFIYVLYQTKIF